GTAIAVRNAEQVVVDTNLLAETGGAGIEVSDTEEVIVTGNTSRGLGRDKSGTGIYFSRVSSGIATANTLSNWACGISIANCRGIVLSDNVCRDSGVGIACADSRNIIVTRNIFDGVSDGIQRSNLAHATVKNNHVTLRR
ncbi:MAG TPA: right-handed parallel beta-helix repeat-containing protein, partial [Armatimonadota bacterium]|nr:right-handed parallel beta-helix repeat-containing protein [Armatimonadota bacterium]